MSVIPTVFIPARLESCIDDKKEVEKSVIREDRELELSSMARSMTPLASIPVSLNAIVNLMVNQ